MTNDFSKYVIDFDKVLNEGKDYETLKKEIFDAYQKAQQKKAEAERKTALKEKLEAQKKEKIKNAEKEMEAAIKKYFDLVDKDNTNLTIEFDDDNTLVIKMNFKKPMDNFANSYIPDFLSKCEENNFSNLVKKYFF